uniref:Uncharacterized protein n=1 Tax=Daphnia magna TaxID=35525 RepID=A0A0P5ZRA6_9CRUS
MKKNILLILLFCSTFVGAQNVAFVSQDSILASIPQFKENMTRIDELTKGYQEEIKIAKEKITENIQKLLANYNVVQTETIEDVKKRMSSKDISNFDLLLEEDKFIEKKAKNYETLLESDYNATVKPILDKINTTIATYAKKNKIEVVYILEQIKPALAYVDSKKYITTQIIKALK